jgi:hypothetical protein
MDADPAATRKAAGNAHFAAGRFAEAAEEYRAAIAASQQPAAVPPVASLGVALHEKKKRTRSNKRSPTCADLVLRCFQNVLT